MEQGTAQRAFAAYSSFCRATSARWTIMRSRGASSWRRYRPDTLLGWTAFLGAALLATSAFCTALCIVSGLLLSLAWVGVVVYTVLGVMIGTVMFVLSATCAVLGTCILSGACTAYVGLAVFNRLRAAVRSHMASMHQILTTPTAEPAHFDIPTAKQAVQSSPLGPAAMAAVNGSGSRHSGFDNTADPTHLHHQNAGPIAAPAAPQIDTDAVQQLMTPASELTISASSTSGSSAYAAGSGSISSQACSTAAAGKGGTSLREQVQQTAGVA